MNTDQTPSIARAAETYFDSAIANDSRWSKTHSWGFIVYKHVSGGFTIRRKDGLVDLTNFPKSAYLPASREIRMPSRAHRTPVPMARAARRDVTDHMVKHGNATRGR